MIVRDARLGDVSAVAAIYAHHVRHGTASFDTDPLGEEIWSGKLDDMAARGWPFLIAERDKAVIGYAYATQFRDRPAYAETCENSIYVAPSALGGGVGSALMNALLDRAVASGLRQMIAVIGGGEPASVALHAKAGYVHAGRMRRVGRKFGTLLDTVYMQRELSAPGEDSSR